MTSSTYSNFCIPSSSCFLGENNSDNLNQDIEMDMSGMTHSHAASPTSSSMSGRSMMAMDMVFQSSHNTPLYSSSWYPTSTGAYAGTCIFLIVLAALLRGLYAGKHILERRWHDKALERRYIRVQGTPTEAQRIDADADGSYGTLVTARGKEESVKVVTQRSRPVMPWRLTVDLPRALYTLLTAGIGYLLCAPLSPICAFVHEADKTRIGCWPS